MAWLPDDAVLAARERLRELFDAFGYACCVPFAAPGPAAAGTDRSGLLFRAAAVEPVAAAALHAVERALGLDAADALRYVDARRSQHRAARLRRDAAGEVRLEAVLLAGDVRAEAWLRDVLQQEQPAAAIGRLVLAPGAKPPATAASSGRTVCTCVGVSETSIAASLSAAAGGDAERLAAVQRELRCGTECGSCLPELRRLVRTVRAAPTGRAATATTA
jgi:assimilatory nitrate reductase catalytic subunit